MTERQKGILEGLQIAAFIVQIRAKDKNSPYSNDIMREYTTQTLKAERAP